MIAIYVCISNKSNTFSLYLRKWFSYTENLRTFDWRQPLFEFNWPWHRKAWISHWMEHAIHFLTLRVYSCLICLSDLHLATIHTPILQQIRRSNSHFFFLFRFLIWLHINFDIKPPFDFIQKWLWFFSPHILSYSEQQKNPCTITIWWCVFEM